MIASVAATLLVLLAASPQASQDRAQAAAAAEAANRSSEAEIEDALWDLLARDPERVVCTRQTMLGSRQPRVACGTVKRWFDARKPEEIAAKRAPWQLVEQIKKGRKEALQKHRGG
jgi:hypothetical protein